MNDDLTQHTPTTVTAGVITAGAPELGRLLIAAMAIACGLAVANIYFNQPMLGLIGRSFAGQPGAVGAIPTATQLGYATGLFLIVPLGDILDRRRLIAVQFAALAVALAAAAASPSALVLVGASFLVGCCASVAQQIVPFAASLATPSRRGAVVGIVMGGLLCGILLSRTFAGLVAAHWGWRRTFWLAVPLALATALFMAVVLPTIRGGTGLRYGAALRSMAALWTEEPALRRATAIQAALFASFSCFWTVLAWRVEGPPLFLGADATGLFGLVGAAGVLAAPIAGRIADRSGPHRALVAGAVLTLAAWPVFALFSSIAGLVVGILLLDLGVQGCLVSNQHTIYALRPEARSRLNTVFMTGMFLGGAAGSALGTEAWRLGGWPGVTALGGALAVVALVRVSGK